MRVRARERVARIDTENEKFALEKVWAPAWIRLERKIKAMQTVFLEARRRKIARGEPPPNTKRLAWITKPLTLLNDEGDLEWNAELRNKILSLSGKGNAGPTAP